jgi:putative flippase GtrA
MEEMTVTQSRLAELTSRLPPIATMAKFVATGGLVAAVQFGVVIVLVLIGLPIQVALALTMIVVLTLHFSLNRQWVFASESGYAFRLSGQGARYLVAAGISYGGLALGTAVFPAVLGVPDLVGLLLASAVMTVVNFAVLHLWIFRTTPAHGDSPE